MARYDGVPTTSFKSCCNPGLSLSTRPLRAESEYVRTTSKPFASAYFWIATDWFSSEYCWCSVDLRRYSAAGTSKFVMVPPERRLSTEFPETLTADSRGGGCAQRRAPASWAPLRADIPAAVTESRHSRHPSTPEMLSSLWQRPCRSL